jgi:hypothetical protein
MRKKEKITFISIFSVYDGSTTNGHSLKELTMNRSNNSNQPFRQLFFLITHTPYRFKSK